MATLAQQLEQFISLGIFVLGFALAALSWLAYRRERDRRMLTVTGAYLLFAVYGLVVFLEVFVANLVGYETAELLEHGGAVLILAGLLAFFLALRR